MNIDLWKGFDNIVLWGVERALSYSLLDYLQHQNVYALVPSNELKQDLKQKLEEQDFDAVLKIELAYLNDKEGEATLREFSLPQMNSLRAPIGIFESYPGLKLLQMQSVKCLSPSSLLKRYELSDQAENALWLEVNGQITSTITAIVESKELYLFAKLLVFMPDQAWYESEVDADKLILKLKQVGYDVCSQVSDLDTDQNLYEFRRHPLVLEKIVLESEVKSLNQSFKQLQDQKNILIKQLEEKVQQVNQLTQKNLAQSQQNEITQKLIDDFKTQQKELGQKLEKIQSEKIELNDRLTCQIDRLTTSLSEKWVLISDSDAKHAQLKENIVHLSGEIVGLKAENEQLEKAHLTKDVDIATINQELGNLNTTYKECVQETNLGKKLLIKANIDLEDLRQLYKEKQEIAIANNQFQQDEPLRIILHFGLPDSEQLLASLAAFPNTQVITDLHLDAGIDDAFRQQKFINDLKQRQQHSSQLGQRLILCDCSPLNTANEQHSPDLIELLAAHSPLKSILIICKPGHSYPAYCQQQSLSQSSEGFEQYCQQLLDYLQQHPDIVQIRYEDFIEQPLAVLQQIGEAFDLPMNEEILMLREVIVVEHRQEKLSLDGSISGADAYRSLCSTYGFELDLQKDANITPKKNASLDYLFKSHTLAELQQQAAQKPNAQLNFSSTLIQWQNNDTDSLLKIGLNDIYQHPDRERLALVLANTYQKLDQYDQAREFARLAVEWGCPKEHVLEIMLEHAQNNIDCAQMHIQKLLS